MDAERRLQVRRRAGDRCEYCLLRQEHEEASPFHVEHIIAQQHGGTDDLENLALACCWCNAIKGPNLASIDPDSGALTRLFHEETAGPIISAVREQPSSAIRTLGEPPRGCCSSTKQT